MELANCIHYLQLERDQSVLYLSNIGPETKYFLFQRFVYFILFFVCFTELTVIFYSKDSFIFSSFSILSSIFFKEFRFLVFSQIRDRFKSNCFFSSNFDLTLVIIYALF